MPSQSHDTENEKSSQAKVFHELLHHLDPDIDRAAEQYERLRRGLIRYFQRQAPTESEVLTDKTIDRVGKRIADGVVIHVRLTTYVRGIAHKILLEHFRETRREFNPPPVRDAEELELDSECMRRCIQFHPEYFELLARYEQADQLSRLRLAERMKVSVAGLRTRVKRARKTLRSCLLKCRQRG